MRQCSVFPCICYRSGVKEVHIMKNQILRILLYLAIFTCNLPRNDLEAQLMFQSKANHFRKSQEVALPYLKPFRLQPFPPVRNRVNHQNSFLCKIYSSCSPLPIICKGERGEPHNDKDDNKKWKLCWKVVTAKGTSTNQF